MILIGEIYTLWAATTKVKQNKVTIVASLGLAMAEVNHGERDRVKLQYTMSEVDKSARLQVG